MEGNSTENDRRRAEYILNNLSTYKGIMPLDPNHPNLKLGGRKGYELEQEQLERMRKILDKDLLIIERLQDQAEINPTDERKLAISQQRVSKYLDKLHPTRESKEHSGEIIIGEPILKLNEILANNSNGADSKDEAKNPDSTGGDISQ